MFYPSFESSHQGEKDSIVCSYSESFKVWKFIIILKSQFTWENGFYQFGIESVHNPAEGIPPFIAQLDWS